MFSLLRRSLVAEKFCYSLSVLQHVNKPEGLKVVDPLRHGKMHHPWFGKFHPQVMTYMNRNKHKPCPPNDITTEPSKQGDDSSKEMPKSSMTDYDSKQEMPKSSMTEEEIEKQAKFCIFRAVMMAAETSQLLVRFVIFTSNVSKVEEKYDALHALGGVTCRKFSGIIHCTLQMSKQVKRDSETSGKWTDEMDRTWKQFILCFLHLDSILSYPILESAIGLSFLEQVIKKCEKNVEVIRLQMDELDKADNVGKK